MISRACFMLVFFLSVSLTASAQFGAPKPTPKSAEEYYAERALFDAAMMSEGVSGNVIRDEDFIDLDSAQRRFDDARRTYETLCEDRTLPRDQWSRSCHGLGDIYRRGLGVAQDYRKAKELYDLACLTGHHAEACIQQAYTSMKGTSGKKDLSHARKLYVKACDLKAPAGCAGLGNMLYRGLGGSQDRSEGRRLLRDACRENYDWACQRLDDFGLTVRVDPYYDRNSR